MILKLLLLTRHLPNLQFFENFSSFGFSPDPFKQNPGYYMVTQASDSDPPFYGIFVPLKISFEKFCRRHCFAVWTPLIKNPSYAYDAEHFFGFCLQVFPLAGSSLRVDCLALMGNMRQVSFPRTQGRIAVTNSEKKMC